MGIKIEDQKGQYSHPAETGRYKITGNNAGIRIVLGSSNFLANTATMTVQTITHPLATTVIEVPSDDGKGTKPATVQGPLFNLLVLFIAALVVLCGIALIALPAVWTKPTAMQSDAFKAMQRGFEWGLALIAGLLGGKGLGPR